MPTDGESEVGAPTQPARVAVFAYKATRDNKVFISWNHRLVTTLVGRRAAEFLARVAGVDEAQAQLLMARATGNFRRGNEPRRTA